MILLPFWREVVGEMDYVVCVRRAKAVIQSVQETGQPGAQAECTSKLWLEVNARALAETVAERRVFVFYEDWHENARTVAARLATFVHGDGFTADAETLDAVMAFFKPELSRAETPDTNASANPELEAMYEHLRLIAARDDSDPALRARQARVAQALAASYGVRQELQEVVESAREEILNARIENQSTCSHAAELERVNRELQDQLAHHREWLDGIERSASWKVTAPLRAAKRGLLEVHRGRRISS